MLVFESSIVGQERQSFVSRARLLGKGVDRFVCSLLGRGGVALCNRSTVSALKEVFRELV